MSVYGLGFKIDNDLITRDKFISICKISAPILYSKMLKYKEEFGRIYETQWKNNFLDFIEEYANTYEFHNGYADVIARLLIEYSGYKHFTGITDYENISYVLYVPVFPWELDESEKEMTLEELKDIYSLITKTFNLKTLGAYEVFEE